MESSRWEQIQAVFHSVADLPEPERRAAIQQACGDDSSLMADVMALLEADARSTSILERNLNDLAHQALDARFEGSHFEALGPYQIIELLGEGGMGVVYLARRRDLGSLVAIKLLRDAWLSPARLDRFAGEQRTLAQLNHPGIARLYDAGILNEGTPWFVMEYVKGVPLTEYCRLHKCSIAERLRIFRAVCEAVQHAHGQAIIHLDLKPSNILVKDDGTVKLLDFGIAKQLEGASQPADKTRTLLRPMTRGYAAPEQIRGERIGTYTDIYSLGVILYELLTGHLPFDLSKLAPDEVDNLVVHSDPAKPSATASGGVASRSSWNDLDVLCLTAMHRDVTHRYQSAEALIRDIDHYQKDEPLEARPDSLRYTAGKFVRRNRRAILAASLVAATIAGLVVFFMVRLTKARNAAQAETARTQRVERFMLDLFQGGDPEAAPSTQLRVATLLDRGARQAAELDSDPQTQGDLDKTLGSMYLELADFKKAEQLLLLALDRAKAEQDRDPSRYAASLVQLGLLRADQAQFQAAEQLVQQGIDVARKQRPPNDLTLLDAQASLGRVLAESGAYDKAIPILEKVSNSNLSGEEGTYILRSTLSALGVAEYYSGHYDIAKSVDQRSIALDRRLLSESHPRTGSDLMNLGTAEAALGNYSAAEADYREGMGIYDAWYGPDHPDSATQRTILGALLIREGKDAEAEPLLEQALAAQEKAYGQVHDRTALTLDMLGRIVLKRGDPQTAQADFTRALAIDRSVMGDDNPRTAAVEVDLGDAYIQETKCVEAEPVLRQAVKVMAASLPAGDLHIGLAQSSWGRALLCLRRYREAEAQLTAGYGNLEKQPRPPLARMEQLRQDLAAAYDALGQPDQAKQFRNGPAGAESGPVKSASIR